MFNVYFHLKHYSEGFSETDWKHSAGIVLINLVTDNTGLINHCYVTSGAPYQNESGLKWFCFWENFG